MPRFHLPLTVDFSTRGHTTSAALTKAAYIQNGFIKQDTTAKVYNRPALKESTGQGTVIQVVAMCEYGTTSLALVGYDTSNGHTNFYTMASMTATPSNVYTISTTDTYDSAEIIPIKSAAGGSTKDFIVKFNHTFKLYKVVIGTGVTAITDADLPLDTPPGMAYLDGYLFIVDGNGQYEIYNSDLSDTTSWNALGFIAPELREGTGVGIETYKNHVLFFGTRNIQFFYDAAGAAPGSPLLPRQDLVYNFGLVIPSDAYAKSWWKSRTGDALAFIGRTHDGKKFIGMFNDFQVEQISNSFINGLLDEYTNLHICGYSYYGKTFIHITINNASSFYYDVETKIWHVFSSSIAHFVSNSKLVSTVSNDTQLAVLTYCYGTHDSANAYAGRLYSFDNPENAHTDLERDGTTSHTVDLVIQTPRYRGEPGVESQRKFMHELQVIGDTLTSADTLSIQYSDDDYQNFITARTVDLTASLKQLQRLGYFRERAFKLTYSGTQQVRLEAIEGQILVGTN